MELVQNLGAPTRTASEMLCKLQSPFLLYIRVYVAWVFLKSGMHKIGDWELTLTLFEYEYQVPLLNFELAAYLATFGELVFLVILIAGFATRFWYGITCGERCFLPPSSTAAAFSRSTSGSSRSSTITTNTVFPAKAGTLPRRRKQE
jgi:hypothetical protein